MLASLQSYHTRPSHVRQTQALRPRTYSMDKLALRSLPRLSQDLSSFVVF